MGELTAKGLRGVSAPVVRDVRSPEVTPPTAPVARDTIETGRSGAPTASPASLQLASPRVRRSASGPLVIAHRGGALEAPENTLAALRHSVAAGADWLEIDVALSRDGKLVVIHDDTLERTTDGTGLVADHTLEQLRALDAGAPEWPNGMPERLKAMGVTTPSFGARFSNERLPTLAEALAVPGGRVMVEMKHSTRPDALADATVDAVRASNAGDRVVLASFEAGLLERAHQRDPELALLGIAGDEDGLKRMLALPVQVVAVSSHIAEKAVRDAPPGVAVWTWTVYTPSEAQRLDALGVDGIITDAPGAIVPAVSRKR